MERNTRGMKRQEFYSKCNTKLYSQIINIKDNPKLHSNFKVFLKSNKYAVIIFTIIFIILIAYTFKLNIMIMFTAILMLFVLVFGMIYYNTYTIEGKDESLICNIDFKKMKIEYKDLINIYISRKNSKILMFFPIYMYSLNIIFWKDGQQMYMTLSTIMVNKQELIKFFDNFEFEVLPEQAKEEERLNQQKQTKRALIITSTIIILVLLVICIVAFAIKQGN